MTFRVGMKVVCVDTSGLTVNRATLRLGGTYTVESVSPPFGEHGVGLQLVGVIRSGQRWVNWSASRFRPAVSPKQEVSFTTGADPDSEIHDNRRRAPVREVGASA